MSNLLLSLKQNLHILYWITGAVIPFTGIVGEVVVLALLVLCLVVSISTYTLKQLPPFIPILSLSLSWGVSSYALYSDATSLYLSLLLMIGVVFVIQITYHRELRETLSRGFFYGLLPAGVLTVLQALVPDTISIFNESEYWSSQGRISGTLQDPNAMGIFAFLSIVSYIARIQVSRVALLTASLWFLALLFSGSRSAMIGTAIFAYLRTLKDRTLFITLTASFLSIVLLVNIAPSLVDREVLPVSIVRSLQLLEIGQLSNSTLNRSVFYQAGFALWIDHPLYGVGLGAFADHLVATSDMLGLGTGLWRDNANSFYLGLLCELGLVGVLCACFMFLHLRSRSVTPNIGTIAGLLSFSCILFTGPHIAFIEILMVFLLLFTSEFEFRVGRCSTLLALIFLPCVLIIPYVSRTVGGGWHNWEKEGDEYYRWSTAYATSYQRCEEGRALLKFRSLHPSSIVSLKIHVHTIEDVFELQSGEFITKEYDCHEQKSLYFEILVNDTWSPAAVGNSPDTRNLGVQVFWSRPSDSLNFDL